MKDKIIIGAVIVLAGVLIFENAYLLGRYDKEKAQRRVAYTRHQPVSVKGLPVNSLPVPYATRYRDPFTEINRMQERMNRIPDNSFSGMPSPLNMQGNKVFTNPGISLNNTGSAYIVKVNMPGMDKKDINIQVKGRQLIISGEKKKEKASKDKNYDSQEISYGNFLSNFMLPEDAQIKRMVSDYKNGVLNITIPRKELER
ncbi:MAG: Hsp20/alpha crystallin family protein [Candidatus Omnitrophica bacterium]|jgi:HSP20 family protein|nr:Hsp20/alpha crystallin family protein [Candidatus Omnitrophota bacterium]